MKLTPVWNKSEATSGREPERGRTDPINALIELSRRANNFKGGQSNCPWGTLYFGGAGYFMTDCQDPMRESTSHSQTAFQQLPL